MPKPETKELERRVQSGLKLEKRSEGDGLPILSGHGAVFNQETVIRDFWFDYREKISPGAFAKDIAAKADVRALIDHMSEKVIARTKSGTLQLSEDSVGLLSVIEPSDTTDGRDIVERIRRGDVDGMSIGFIVRKQVWTDSADEEMELRDIQDVQLIDVSPVTFPAYPQTDIAVRHMLRDPELEEFEAIGKLLVRAKTNRLRDSDHEEADRLIEKLRGILKRDKVIEAAEDDAVLRMLQAEAELELLSLEVVE